MYNRIAQIERIKHLVDNHPILNSSEKGRVHNLCSVCKSALIIYLEECYDVAQAQTRLYVSAMHNNQTYNDKHIDNDIKDDLLKEIQVLTSKLNDLDEKIHSINENIFNCLVSESYKMNALYQEIISETKLDRVHQQLQNEQNDLLRLAYSTNEEINKLHLMLSTPEIVAKTYICQFKDNDFGFIALIIISHRRRMKSSESSNISPEYISTIIIHKCVKYNVRIRLIPLRKKILIIISYYYNNVDDNITPDSQEIISLSNSNMMNVRGLIALLYFLHHTINISNNDIRQYEKLLFKEIYDCDIDNKEHHYTTDSINEEIQKLVTTF